MKIIIYVRAREDNLHPNRFTITAILFEALTAIMTEAMIVANHERLYPITFFQNIGHEFSGGKL